MTRARLTALLSLFAACALTAPARAQTLTTVHVMTVPIDAGAEVYYAKELGFFAKAGLDVDIQPAANGGAAAAAVAGNAVDIVYTDMARRSRAPDSARSRAMRRAPGSKRTAAISRRSSSSSCRFPRCSRRSMRAASMPPTSPSRF